MNKNKLLSFLTVPLLLTFFVLRFWQARPTPIQGVGCVLVTVFITLVIVARLQLGSSFSVTAQARALVTTGLYSRIRNPIYIFGALAILSMSLVLSNWIPVVLVVVVIPMQIIRIRKEEAVLAETFGEEYLRYKSQTWI